MAFEGAIARSELRADLSVALAGALQLQPIAFHDLVPAIGQLIRCQERRIFRHRDIPGFRRAHVQAFIDQRNGVLEMLRCQLGMTACDRSRQRDVIRGEHL